MIACHYKPVPVQTCGFGFLATSRVAIVSLQWLLPIVMTVILVRFSSLAFFVLKQHLMWSNSSQGKEKEEHGHFQRARMKSKRKGNRSITLATRKWGTEEVGAWLKNKLRHGGQNQHNKLNAFLLIVHLLLKLAKMKKTP